MKIGFDNEKYLREQGDEIRRRAAKLGKLYLEFGGKLMNDFHAARCLPGYDPNAGEILVERLDIGRVVENDKVVVRQGHVLEILGHALDEHGSLVVYALIVQKVGESGTAA